MYLIEENGVNRSVSNVTDIDHAIKKIQQGKIIKDSFDSISNNYLEAGLYTIVDKDNNCIYIINVESSSILSYFDTKTILKKYTFAEKNVVANSVFKFKKWLLQFHNYNNLNITDDDLELVKTSLGTSLKYITIYKVRNALRENKLEKYMDNAYFILLKIKNPNLYKLSEQDMQNIITKYTEFRNIYDSKILNLSYFYILHKICENIKLEEFIKSYPYVKKVNNQEIEFNEIWSQINNVLKW